MEFYKIIAGITTISLLRYFFIAGGAFFLCYKLFYNRIPQFKIQLRNARKKDLVREIQHSALTCLIIGCMAYAIMRSPFADYTKIYHNLHTYPLWYLPVQVLLALLIHDTYFYWIHRLMHLPAIYRYTHALHHKSVTPTPFASYSFSVPEALLEALVLLPVVLLVPMHRAGILCFTFLGFLMNVYGHLGYEFTPKWLRNSVLFKTINTSVHHNLHHSRFSGNYGLYFRFWDKIMGTENPDYEKLFDEITNRQKK